MAQRGQFRESVHAADLVLHNIEGLLTKLEEGNYSSKAGLSYPQFLILITIEASEPPVTETDVADSIQRNLNTVSMMLDRMEKAGLVKRERSGKDRREVHVSLTPVGKNKLGKGIDVGGALSERLGSAFSAEEIEKAMLLMGKLRNQLLKEMGREPIPIEDRRPLRESVIEVFRKYRSQKVS
jgi:DNA-binding MarR family transcriptional regulator